ncbi:MAG: hypothetical protein H7311_13605 [Ramlibacter sp.]|nr:hypothetical protein [Cryobacterium sp.]
MNSDLDGRLSQSALRGLADDAAVVDSAQRLANAVADSVISPARKRAHRVKMVIGLGIAIAIGGATTATAVPALIAWAPWEPDAAVSRSFPLTGGGTADCTMIIKVGRDVVTADEHLEENVANAREFLRDHDWSQLVVSADLLSQENTTAQRAKQAADAAAAAEGFGADGASGQRSGNPSSTAAEPRDSVLEMNFTEQAMRTFITAGLMKPGVSVESGTRCDEK